MGGRILTCVILAILAVGANCQDAEPSSAIQKSNICKLCKCEDSKVNCFDQSITTFFTKQEWTDLTDFKPKIVDLSENRFTNVTVIADLTIEVLNLSRCSIEFIENASFRDLQEMRVLDLSHNQLTTAKLSPHAFEGRFMPEEYEPLASLRILNLAYNDLHSIHPDLFEHMPELEELDLSGNPLTTIDHVTLIAISSLPMLKVLRMRSCQLEEIPSKFLHTPRYLKRLDISDNLLTAVPQELEEAKDLVYLNLNQNPILQLDAFSDDYPGFPRLRKLQELHMCNMPKLRRIGEGTLAGLESVQRLHISFNPKLSFVDPKALARPDDIGETYDWPLVKELYLRSNNLSEVDSRLLSRWDLLEKVDVSDNPYLCDCSTQWMVDVLAPAVEKKGGNASAMVCQEPVEMKGYTMKHLHDIHRTMRCVDKYGHRPEKDGAILLGTLIAEPSNAVQKSNICKLCKCKDSKVNCFDQSITTFFTKQEWTDLTDFKPKIVDLSENRFTNVTVIADLTIEVLNLSRCSIKFIENASFRNLQEMRVLDLSHNQLTTAKLSPHAFEGRFMPEEYEPLSSLRILNLAYNDLQSIHLDLFEHMPELEELDLSGNPLTTINHVTLIAISSLPMLKVLRMRSCQLEAIPSNFLHTFRYLKCLDISDNLFTAVPQQLEEAKDLVYLNLNQNPILQLDAFSDDYPGFPRLRKLQELHMCNMPKLRRIGEGTLAGLESVQRLHISFNPKLSFVDPKALARPDDIGQIYDWPLVKELYLRSNNLSVVDSRLLSRWDLLEKVDVSDNPYLCDCTTKWMVDVLAPAVEKKGGNASAMECQEPVEMKGYTMKQLHDIHRTMRCVDKYGHRPEKNGAILLDTLIDDDQTDQGAKGLSREDEEEAVEGAQQSGEAVLEIPSEEPVPSSSS